MLVTSPLYSMSDFFNAWLCLYHAWIHSEVLSLPGSPAYSLLPSYWPFSSLLNQSQWHIFTQCKGISCQIHVFLRNCLFSSRKYSSLYLVTHFGQRFVLHHIKVLVSLFVLKPTFINYFRRGVHAQHQRRGQKTTCRSQFSPSTMWVPRSNSGYSA